MTFLGAKPRQHVASSTTDVVVDPWLDRKTFPLLFEVQGTPCVLPPIFRG